MGMEMIGNDMYDMCEHGPSMVQSFKNSETGICSNLRMTHVKLQKC